MVVSFHCYNQGESLLSVSAHISYVNLGILRSVVPDLRVLALKKTEMWGGNVAPSKSLGDVKRNDCIYPQVRFDPKDSVS